MDEGGGAGVWNRSRFDVSTLWVSSRQEVRADHLQTIAIRMPRIYTIYVVVVLRNAENCKTNSPLSHIMSMLASAENILLPLGCAGALQAFSQLLNRSRMFESR